MVGDFQGTKPVRPDRTRSLPLPRKRTIRKEWKSNKGGFVERQIMVLLAPGWVELSQQQSPPARRQTGPPASKASRASFTPTLTVP